MTADHQEERARRVAAQHVDAADDMLVYERFDEALSHYDKALTLLEPLGEPLGPAGRDGLSPLEVLFKAARAARLGARHDTAESLLRRAVAQAVAPAQRDQRVRALALLARLHEDLARPRQARETWETLLALAPPDAAHARATAHGSLAELALTRGDLAGADGHLAAAHALALALDDGELLGASALGRGRLHRLRGETERALAALDEAVSLFGQRGDMPRLALALGQQGNLKRDAGQLQSARQLYQASLTMAEAGSDAAAAGSALTNLANVAMSLGEPDVARAHYREAIDIAAACNHHESLLGNLVNLAGLEASEGELDRARARYREALSALTDLELPRAEIDISMLLAQLEARDGQLETARALIEGATQRAEAIGYDAAIARLRVNAAGMAHVSGQIGAALTLYREGLAALEALGRPADSLVAALSLAECELAAGRPEAASTTLDRAAGHLLDPAQREALDLRLMRARVALALAPDDDAPRSELLALGAELDARGRPLEALGARLVVAEACPRQSEALGLLLTTATAQAPRRLERGVQLELRALDCWRRGDLDGLFAIASDADAAGLALLALRVRRRIVDVSLSEHAPGAREAAAAAIAAAEAMGYGAELSRLRALLPTGP